MTDYSLSVKDLLCPQILTAEKDFLVVYKPPKMHTAFLPGGGWSLTEWCAALYPRIMDIRGRKQGEGGLLHRLDYETSGLVLFAGNQAAFDSLAAQQEEGRVIKEYRALTRARPPGLPGFPPPPFPRELLSRIPPPAIESAFRPYGPGRKEVRPAALPLIKNNKKSRAAKETAFDKGGPYRTEIMEAEELNEAPRPEKNLLFKLKIRRGFRHQIRCHLAWLGFPILGDTLYGGAEGETGFLMLRAGILRFERPGTGEELVYGINNPPSGQGC